MPDDEYDILDNWGRKIGTIKPAGNGFEIVGFFLALILFAVIVYWGIASIAIAFIMAPFKLYEKGNKYGVAYWAFTRQFKNEVHQSRSDVFDWHE